jgi:predicted nuclease of predicted toxin-antitoxin system
MPLRFKIDENLPSEAVELLEHHGFDASSVVLQRMVGRDDAGVALTCRDENRIVVTLDRGMALHAMGHQLAGLSVLVLRPIDQSKPAVLSMIDRVAGMVKDWKTPFVAIVSENSVRLRRGGPPDGPPTG